MTMTRRLHALLRLLGVVALVLLCAGSALAFPRPTVYGQIANTHIEGTVIFWDEIRLNYDNLTVRVTAPCGDFSIDFRQGETPFFDIRDLEGDPDGTYTWELIADPTIDPGVEKLLLEVRGTSKEKEVVQDLWDAGKLPRGPFRQAGTFQVSEGLIVSDDEVEKTDPRLEARKPESVGSSAETSESGELRNVSGAGTVLTGADGIIRNSLCVGFDCPTNPTFNDTTILLMENNNRIKFDDTSSISGFPNRDWELEANSNLSGGSSHFAINDCGNSSQGGCANDPVFIIEANAPGNSIRVDSGGRVGLKNANPTVELHISDGDTPTVRLDQTGASGFAPQIWDLAGNETTFFIRDVSSGSTLPFRIRPGAASNSLVIDSDDDIGMGILSPAAKLHVVGTSTSLLRLQTAGVGRIEFRDSAGSGPGGSNVDWDFRTTTGDAFIINGLTNVGNEFLLNSLGDLTILGTLTTGGPTCMSGCDRVFHDDFELESIEEHAEQMWSNSYLPAVGPTLPGAPFNVSEKTGGILNELEKAHIYIEQLHNRLEEKVGRLAEVERKNEDLTERLSRIEALLADPGTDD